MPFTVGSSVHTTIKNVLFSGIQSLASRRPLNKVSPYISLHCSEHNYIIRQIYGNHGQPAWCTRTSGRDHLAAVRLRPSYTTAD